MRRIIVILMLTLAVGCAKKAPTLPDIEKGVYASSKYGFVVGIPAGWQAMLQTPQDVKEALNVLETQRQLLLLNNPTTNGWIILGVNPKRLDNPKVLPPYNPDVEEKEKAHYWNDSEGKLYEERTHTMLERKKVSIKKRENISGYDYTVGTAPHFNEGNFLATFAEKASFAKNEQQFELRGRQINYFQGRSLRLMSLVLVTGAAAHEQNREDYQMMIASLKHLP